MDWKCFAISSIMFFIGGFLGLNAGLKAFYNTVTKDLKEKFGIEMPTWKNFLFDLIKDIFRKL